MLQVDLTHILTEEDAVSRIQEIFAHVEQQKETYLILKDGRPMVAIVDVSKLEEQTSEAASPQSMPAPQQTAPATSVTPVPAPFQAPVNPAPAPVPTPSTPPLAQAEQPEIMTDVRETGPSAPIAPFSAPTPQVSDLPPLNGSLDLPDMPEDPSNTSPLA